MNVASNSSQETPSNLVWMDLEMTGLDPERDTILEIATIVTDGNLNILEYGPNLVIQQDPKRFDTMDNWNKEQHTKSGLWSKAIQSDITLSQAELITFEFIKKHVDHKKSPLCGNSIWQDRRFLRREMKKIDNYLHYRMVDVSTVKELVKRWYPNLNYPKPADNNHRALEDVVESIQELKFYRENFFKS